MIPSFVTEQLLQALSNLVAWQDKIDKRRNGKPCACVAGRGRPRCVQCRARRYLKTFGSRPKPGSLDRNLRLLVQRFESRYWTCERGECDCLLCLARAALLAYRQSAMGLKVTGQPLLRKDARKEGGVCRHGHSLTGENVLRLRRQIYCRQCKLVSLRAYFHRKPKKRVPGHCRSGLHPLSGENLYIRPSTGDRQCRACKRASAAVRRERSRQQRPEAVGRAS